MTVMDALVYPEEKSPRTRDERRRVAILAATRRRRKKSSLAEQLFSEMNRSFDAIHDETPVAVLATQVVLARAILAVCNGMLDTALQAEEGVSVGNAVGDICPLCRQGRMDADLNCDACGHDGLEGDA